MQGSSLKEVWVRPDKGTRHKFSKRTNWSGDKQAWKRIQGHNQKDVHQTEKRMDEYGEIFQQRENMKDQMELKNTISKTKKYSGMNQQ